MHGKTNVYMLCVNVSVCDQRVREMENWKNLIHLYVTVFLSCFAGLIVVPTIPDVTLEAVCPGEDECSLAIYLTGLQQAITGIGSVVMVPLIGSLSDAYGRKNLLTFPLTLGIIPLVILAVKRTTVFFYVYYVLTTLAAMVGASAAMCLYLSYLADNVSERSRVSAFGLLTGVVSAATVCGTLVARLLPINQIFQVAAVASIIAAVYMITFLKDDTARHIDPLEQPIFKTGSGNDVIRKLIPLPRNIITLLKSSVVVSLASSVAFFNSLADGASHAFVMYYLKARFGFEKNQFADMWLITYVGATISNITIMPSVGPILGEETLLCVALFAGFLNMLLVSIAWSSWVPYASASLGMFIALANPCVRCIISKKVGPYQQGIAQGCLLGIDSFAHIVSPLIFSPLSALFLSGDAPFNFPGFCILCVGLAWLVSFVLSIVIKFHPVSLRGRVLSNVHNTLA